jgi:hypothetical protein
MYVLIINGYPRSGKDTFCDNISGVFSCKRYSTVDTPKRILTDMGWDGVKTPEIRKALSDIKDMYTSLFDGPFKEAVKIIKDSIDNNISIVTVMCREPVEIDKLKQWCIDNNIRCSTIFIDRGINIEELNNHADLEVSEYEYDYYIKNNNSKSVFRDRSRIFIVSLLGESDAYF